ncbi:MAG: hypothetical protein ACTHOU_15565 [Aureliella sp.]
MSKPQSFRFSLSALLLLVTCTGLFMAYARQRRAAIVQESDSLRSEGIRLQWERGALNLFWPAVPRTAYFEFNELPSGRVEIAGVTYPLDEALARSDAILKRLKRFGVDEIQLVKNGAVTNTYVSTE